jgi:predicted CXXCH cytochrome family protein
MKCEWCNGTMAVCCSLRQLAIGLILICLVSGLVTSVPASPGTDEGFGPHSLDTGFGARAAVCNFCHTPQEGVLSSGPGWELGPQVPEFRGYDIRRSDGNVDTRSSVSIACLSCHDGGQATDVALNMPYTSASRDIQHLDRPITHEHPVGIVFSGYQLQASPDPITSNRLQREIIGNEIRWWLDMEAMPDGVRDKTDVILYTRGAGAGSQPFIECGSCHDPHANLGNMFLRVSNAGSNLCQACHNY